MKARVEFDGTCRMKVVVEDGEGEHHGKYTDYRDIATLVVGDRIFMAVTEYGLGCPPLMPEKVYEVKEV